MHEICGINLNVLSERILELLNWLLVACHLLQKGHGGMEGAESLSSQVKDSDL